MSILLINLEKGFCIYNDENSRKEANEYAVDELNLYRKNEMIRC